jgi:hypothetical protein
MVGVCSKHEGKREMNEKFLSENTNGRYNYKDIVVDGNVILEWILGKSNENE